MSKSEEILRPSDYVDDPGECLFDVSFLEE